MKIICPYCKKYTLECNGVYNAFLSYNQYKCINHKLPVLLYSIDNFSIVLIRMGNIIINYVGNVMFFYLNSSNIKLPIDNNLTPENIEQKIKTYLTFQ